MSQLWYYEDHGSTIGPIPTEVLIQKIKNNEIQLLDLVFKEGETQWLPVQSFTEITESLGSVTFNQSSEWIVLKTVNVDGREVQKQIGPYNAQQILDLIDKGIIRFSDYVWREGYENWVPLGHVDQFEKPLKSSVNVDRSLYLTPRHEDFLEEVSVIRVAPREEPFLRDESKPEEAEGEDLTLPAWALPLRTVTRDESDYDEAVDLVPPTEEELLQRRKQKAQRKLKNPTDIDQKVALQKMSIQEELALQHLELAEKAPVDGVERVYPTEDKAGISFEESVFTEDKKRHRNESESFFTRIHHSMESRTLQICIGVGGLILVAVVAQVSFNKISPDTLVNFSIQVEKTKATASGVNSSEEVSISSKPIVQKTYSVKNVPPALQESSVQASRDVSRSRKEPSKNKKKATKKTTDRITEEMAEKRTEKKAVKTNQKNITYNAGLTEGPFKNRAHFHHQERLFIYYTAIQGEALVDELQKMAQKHSSSTSRWKSFYSSWHQKAKILAQKSIQRSQQAVVHKSLFKELAKRSGELAAVGAEANTRMIASQKKRTQISVNSLAGKFRDISVKAKNLDK